MTDYQTDIERLGTAGEMGLAAGGEHTTRLLYRRFQRLSLQGDVAGLGALDAAIDGALSPGSAQADLWLLKATIAVKQHRFAAAEGFLRGDASLQGSPQAWLLQADVDLQLGRYESALCGIERALAEDPTWDAFARRAYLASVFGEYGRAEALYVAAQDELTAKQMHSFAWLEMQRGAMCFSRGQYESAITRYLSADAAYTGCWLVQERMAEVLGARGQFAEAIARYEQLHAETPRPEWEHALADLSSLAGKHQNAAQWKTRALKSYLASVERGEVHLYHYLVDLCCELPGMAQEAVLWARKDVAMRSNYATEGDLAWALYRAGERLESLVWMRKALASGAVSARLYTQGACLFADAGRRDSATRLMRLALATNPAPAKALLPPGEIRFAMSKPLRGVMAADSARGT